MCKSYACNRLIRALHSISSGKDKGIVNISTRTGMVIYISLFVGFSRPLAMQ